MNYFKQIERLGTKGGAALVTVALVLMLAAALFVTALPAMADDPFTTRPHEWTARQNFYKETNQKSGASVYYRNGSNQYWEKGSRPVYATDMNLSGATATQAHPNVATLGGLASTGTSTIAFGASTAATTGSAAGCSGWHLTAANLQTYSTFLVDNSSTGISHYASPQVVGAPGNVFQGGGTVYLTGLLSSAVHGKVFEFTNIGGTTAFVLWDGNGRFNGGTGTTQSPGTAREPEDKGDTIVLRAVYFPTSVSGWYVTNIWVND